MTAPSRGRDRIPVAMVAPLALGSLLNPINSSMIATALAPIARALDASVSEIVWLVAALYVTSSVAQPTMGKLADRWGARRVFLIGLVLERGLITRTLAAVAGNQSEAARRLGLGRGSLIDRMRKCGLLEGRRAGTDTPEAELG